MSDAGVADEAALYCTHGAMAYAKISADRTPSAASSSSENRIVPLGALPELSSHLGNFMDAGVRVHGGLTAQARLASLNRLQHYRRANQNRVVDGATSALRARRLSADDDAVVAAAMSDTSLAHRLEKSSWSAMLRAGGLGYARAFEARADALAETHATTTMHAFALLERCVIFFLFFVLKFMTEYLTNFIDFNILFLARSLRRVKRSPKRRWRCGERRSMRRQ